MKAENASGCSHAANNASHCPRKSEPEKTFTLATGCHLWFCLKTEKAWQLWSWKWFRCIQL